MLTVSEIGNALFFLVFLHQQTHFSKTIKDFFNKNLTSKRPFYKLNPIIRNDLLSVGGRLSHALLEDDVQHPLILLCYFGEFCNLKLFFLTLCGVF